MSPRQRHSSPRRRFLVAYDIADHGRLRMMHKTVKAHGELAPWSAGGCRSFLDNSTASNELAALPLATRVVPANQGR